jgi:hypothetical protein
MGGDTDLLRRATDCFNRADWDGLTELLDEDCRMTALENWPEAGPFVGRDAVLRQFHRLRDDAAGSTNIEIIELAERDGWVIARFRWVIEGAASGAQVEAELTGALRYENGRSVELHYRFDEGEALEAAGLSETGS